MNMENLMQMWALQHHEETFGNLIWTDERVETLERCSKMYTTTTTTTNGGGHLTFLSCFLYGGLSYGIWIERLGIPQFSSKFSTVFLASVEF